MNFLYKNLLPPSSRLTTVYKTHYNPVFDHLDFHPHFELYFCPKPIKQTVKINGAEYRIAKPCAIISRPYTVHIMLAEDTFKEFERYVVYFSREYIDSFGDWIFDKALFEATVLFQSDELNDPDFVLPVFNEGKTEGERGAHLAVFFSKLKKLSPWMVIKPENSISDILEYISLNISEKLDGETVAKRFNISRATLDRFFSKYVGQSLHQTVTDMRLYNAMTLLKRTELSVSEIAYKCGFEGEQYFYSFFKKHIGVTPRKYRKNDFIGQL